MEIFWVFLGAWLTLIAQKLFEKISDKALDKTIDKALDKITAQIFISRENKRSQAIKKFIDYFDRFDVVQSGWKNSLFKKDDIEIFLDGKFSLNKKICSEIKDKNYNFWLGKNYKNNEQIGVIDIDAHRVSDNVGEKSHILKVKAHKFEYFDFLSTNRILIFGNDQEKAFINSYIPSESCLDPVKEFANPISVGLSFFCDNGRCLVLTRRTTKESSGGEWSGGKIFNAVGETVAPIDISEYKEGYPIINPFLTAKRGLYEEIGITNVKSSHIKIHSFVRDREILDYKFFGYFVSSLSRGEIELSWRSAPDKSESSELIFYDLVNTDSCEKIISEIINNTSLWSKEASYSTVLSIIMTKKISKDKIYNLFE